MNKIIILFLLNIFFIPNLKATVSIVTGGSGSSGGMHVAKATVLPALNLLKNNDLNFGTIIPSGASSGYVQIPASGDVIYNNTAQSGGNTAHRGNLTITGPAGITVNVSGSPSANLTTNASGTGVTTMALSDTGISGITIGNNNNTGTVVLDENGTATLETYGKLTVSSNQTAGEYSAEYPITISY